MADRDPLLPPPGDGRPDDMEARIARLEVDIEYIKRDVGDLKLDVRAILAQLTGQQGKIGGLEVEIARLDEHIKALPTKGFITSGLVTTVGLMTAIIVLADKIKTLVGVAH